MARALMRILMSFDTSTTLRFGLWCCKSSATARIWLSALPLSGSALGNSTLAGRVCSIRRPDACLVPRSLSGTPFSMSLSWLDTISSRKRVACRALRATSVMPFLLLSNSSSVIIGRYISCSSNRNSDVGSCMSTLVSSTKILVVLVFGEGALVFPDLGAKSFSSVDNQKSMRVKSEKPSWSTKLKEGFLKLLVLKS